MKAKSCTQCESQKEVLARMIYVASSILGYTMPDDTARLMRDSACFACLSDKQMLDCLYSVMTQEVNPTETRTSIGLKSKCLDCCNTRQLKAAFVYLWCQLWQQKVTPS